MKEYSVVFSWNFIVDCGHAHLMGDL